MAEPTIVPRADHTISRRDVDPDALKVLYRLHEHHYIAYLVGGSVRDLLLNRRPKDFDIGTSAHPHQVKKLFRNCWIIGRRFRLAHVKFGTKTIEVATFRRHVEASPVTPETEAADAPPIVATAAHEPGATKRRADDHLIHRDNTYGTPEEDAFRRDFTVNALFYDIGTFSIIDYVGGLDDLDARVIRCIGDPEVRFLEDPVRMLRAVVLGARLRSSS
jgi:poly(A) polymerase